MNPRKKIDVVEYSNTPTTPADCVVKIKTVGCLTHIMFAETRPSSFDTAELERAVVLRLVVPSDLVTLMARTILAAVTTRDWILPDDEDTAELRIH